MHQLDLYFLPAEGEALLRSRNPLQTVNPQTQKNMSNPSKSFSHYHGSGKYHRKLRVYSHPKKSGLISGVSNTADSYWRYTRFSLNHFMGGRVNPGGHSIRVCFLF